MNKPNQVVPSFVSVYFLANQVVGVSTPLLFDIINTDGSDLNIYDSSTGQFAAPVSGWYDLDGQIISTAALTDVKIVKNGDTNFPIMSRIPDNTSVNMKIRIKLGLGETLRFEATGGTILANAGTVPDSKASNAIFTLVKRFDDTRSF